MRAYDVATLLVVASLPGRGWPASRAIAPLGVGKDAPPPRWSARRGLGPAGRSCSRQGDRSEGFDRDGDRTGTEMEVWDGGGVSNGAAVAWVTGASRGALSACPGPPACRR